jgi:hypothetical protein
MKDALDRLAVLREQHAIIDQLCEQEYAQYQDDFTLNQHKMQRVQLKREIDRLEKEVDNEPTV